MTLLAVLAGCGRIDFDPRTDAGAGIDAQPRCNPQAPFTSITRVDSLDTAVMIDGAVRMTSDETTAYFHSDRNFTFEIWSATRTSRELPFGAPQVVLSSPPTYWPTVTADQLTVLYSTNTDIMMSTRGAVSDAFAPGAVVPALDSTANQTTPFLGPLGNTVYFARYEPDAKLYEADWPATSTPRLIPELDGPGDDVAPVLSDDELVMYFSRADSSTQPEIVVATRDTVTASFGAPAFVTELSSPQADSPTWLSRDLCRLYFESLRNGTDWDIYLAERQP